MVALVIKKEQRTAQYFKEQLGNNIELDMILVPGGEFIMGSPDTEESHEDAESPQHLVSIKSFFLGRYPVTQEQWQIVAETYEHVNTAVSRFMRDSSSNVRTSFVSAQNQLNLLLWQSKYQPS